MAEHVRHLLSGEIIWDVFFASLSLLRISQIFPRSGKCPHEIPASMVSLHFLFLFMLGESPSHTTVSGSGSSAGASGGRDASLSSEELLEEDEEEDFLSRGMASFVLRISWA